jgi:hypothetical protein
MDPHTQDAHEIEYELIIEEHDSIPVDRPTYRTLTSHSMELGLDEVLLKLNDIQSPRMRRKKNPSGQKKRGRKPIRPLDPIKRKTEEKDKYWLRTFRKYVKENFSKFSNTLTLDDYNFWVDHLSTTGVPEKGNQFSSYGKKYKNYLFSNFDFVSRFQQWFIEHGEAEISKKYSHDSDLWFVFYDYAAKELFNYVPRGCSSLNSGGSHGSSESPRSYSLNDISYRHGSEECVDFCMVGDGDQELDSYLNQL